MWAWRDPAPRSSTRSLPIYHYPPFVTRKDSASIQSAFGLGRSEGPEPQAPRPRRAANCRYLTLSAGERGCPHLQAIHDDTFAKAILNIRRLEHLIRPQHYASTLEKINCRIASPSPYCLSSESITGPCSIAVANSTTPL